MAKRGLGKGLDALLASSENEYGGRDEPGKQEGVTEVKLTEIEPDPSQPRKDFDQEKLQVLAESIKEHGVIQPLIVGKTNGFYRIIAGERRWRASKLAGLKTVPVVIRDYSSEQSAEVALVENLQREDLNGIEEAMGYKRLMEEFGLTQQQVSERVGKSRAAVANTLRLLNLPESIRDMVVYRELSSGHARTLAALDDAELQKDFAQRVIAEDLSVRQLEKLIAGQKEKKDKPDKQAAPEDINMQTQLQSVQQELQSHLGTKVKIVNGKHKGRIEIEYYDYTEFERLIELIRR